MKRKQNLLVFLSGSINSGKTTTMNALAKRLGTVPIDVDNLNDTIPNFNLATDLDKSMDLAIKEINTYLKNGRDVVANYVVRQKDYARFASEIQTARQYVITRAPKLEVAHAKRGERHLSEWEVARVKYHYETGIATPNFGYIIDNSDFTVDQTVDEILRLIG